MASVSRPPVFCVALLSQNDPPPPYYASPVQPHSEIGEGINYQPYYIPPPSHVQPTTYVAQERPIPPKSKLCGGNKRCFGGSGGSLILSGLIGVAIWLGGECCDWERGSVVELLCPRNWERGSVV
ncbi:UNVERIFIED_CONTAM: hypothetical protein FKN15_015188 [Acipenser sinensis]